MFELKKTEGKARRGEFTCAHGTVQTPVFMNVGTQAAIKGGLSAFDRDFVEAVCSVGERLVMNDDMLEALYNEQDFIDEMRKF